MKKSGTLVLQYCYAQSVEGQLAANGILHTHPEGTKLLLQSLAEAGDMFKPTPEDEEVEKVEKRKLVLNDTKTRTVFGAQGTNTTLRSLRGVQKYAGDVSGDVTKLRSLEAPLTSRRLDGDDGDDKEEKKKKVKGPDSAMLVVQWTQRQWKEFIEKIKAENVTEDDYPNARNKIPCDEHPMVDVVPFLYLMHELELIRRMMHTYTGTFLLMFIAIFSCGAAYITYYRTVMMKSQRRVKWLEPGFLSIFVLDCGLIGFTKSAAKIVSQPTLVTFFFWKPERWEVQAFVLAGVVLYPVVFVALTYYMISEVTKPSDELEEEEEGQETKKPDEKALKTKMVFNEDVEQWIDPTAREIKVTLEPPIPSWIPVLGEMITSHVRSCIPVLTVDGDPISFRTDVVTEEEKKVKPVVDKEKLQEEAAELEKKLNEELAENATDATKKDRTNRAATIKEEQETLKKINERAQKHLGTVKSIKEEMEKVQETYCKEVTPGEKGPSGDPTWFPAEPSKPAEGEEEEEFTFEKRSIFDLLTEWKSVKGREENEVLDAEESFAIRSYIEGHIRREKRLTKYNIMQVGTYKGYLLPKEPFNIVKKKDPNGATISVRERADPTPIQLKDGAEPCPHWWLPKDEKTLTVNGMEYELDEFGPSMPPLPAEAKAAPPPPPYIQNSQGQRLVYESGQMGPLWRFLGRLKVGFQEAGVVRWMDEPEDGWEVFEKSVEEKQKDDKKSAEEKQKDEKSGEEKPKDDKGKKYANMVYANKWQWIYLDKWDLPWSGDDEEEKHLNFCGCWSVAKDDIPLFRIMEKALLKRFKTYVPKEIRPEEKNEIRQWMWKGLLGFAELKLKLGWMAKQHPRYKLPEISEIVTKPFDVFLLELAHAKPDQALKFDKERETDKNEELLNFTLMKFEDLFPDDEEPWWEESDKPADNERKVMFDHDVFFQDSGGDEKENLEFKTRWKENKLIPEHGYYSSSCFTRFPEDTFGKKRYIVKKPDDPVESIARVEINVRLKHVLPLMRYTSHFKACVPINSLELPLRSNLQIILKESGNGEQYNYTVDRLTNLISIGVLASQPPGPVCAITLLLLQMVNFANRFYTNKESAKAVAKLMDEEEAREEEAARAADASEKEPLTGGDAATKKKKLSPMKERIRKKREAMKNKTLLDSFLEVEVFKMFLQSLVLFLLCAGQFGWMPGPICALMCILVCVFTMIFMNVSTFRKEMNKQIESISNSVTEFYRMYRGYENAVLAWLSGENIFGWKFFNFEGAHASNLENISDVNFVVPELGLRLTGKTVVDDLLPQDEKIKQQLLKYTAYFANLRADSRAKVKAASDLQRYHQDIAPSFTLALSVDQLKLCQAIPPIAATIQCVNHAGSSISSPDFDSYYTLYYPEAWEDEHDHDKAAVQQLTTMWKDEVKTWMDEQLGATYSDRTYTKKIQEHIAALMGMPFEHGRSRHCVMIKLEQTLIPAFVPLRTSCREEIYKNMQDKMLFVTVLYEDEDFTVDLAYNRTSPLGRIVKMTDKMKEDLMYEGRRPDETPKAPKESDGDESPEPPAMTKTKSHFSIRPDMGKLKRFVALLAEEGEEPPIFAEQKDLEQFAFICEHEACEFKVPIPATVSKFKLMVWFQNDENGQHTEELIGFSEPFDLILPDEAEMMGVDQADQKRIPFYTSWHTTLTQGLKIIEADDPVAEATTWFGRLRNQVREYLAPAVTKTHVMHCTGFVDMSVRNLTAEELKIDQEQVDAMKDVTVGNSEINKAKLKRHLDRRGVLSTFFGLRMEDACIDGEGETLKAHLKRLEDFYQKNQSGWSTEVAEKVDAGRRTKLENLLLDKDIRRSLWKNDEMEKAIESIKQAIKDYEETKKKEADANIKIYPRYKIAYRNRGPRFVSQEIVDFDTAVLAELKNFKKDQARQGKSILHYVMVADHLKHNKFWSPDAISPHVCGIIVNNTPDVPSVRLQCHKFNQPAAGEDPKAKISKDMVFHRETLGSSKELPAFVNGRLCFKATDEEAEKYYKAFVPESPETWKVAKKDKPEVQEWHPVYLYWDGFARWVVSPFRGEPAPYGLATDTNQNLFLFCRDQATTPDRISKTQFKKWENGMWKEDSSIRVLNRDGSMATKKDANRAEQLRVHAKSVNEDSGQSSWIGEMFKGLMFIFVSTTSKKSSPEIKECLIGLEGGNITIAWKDIHQESLAPLRTFLLDEFTTYQAAWVFLCRNCTIKKTVCVRNLARMLRRTLEGMQAMLKVRERIETQEKRKRMKAEAQMAKSFTTATGEQSKAPAGNEEEEEAENEEEEKPKEEVKKEPEPAKSTLFSGFGRMLGSAAKSAKAAAAGMASSAKNAASAVAGAAMGPSDEAKRKENEKKMLDYLNRVVTEDPNYVEKICKEIMDQLDHDKDGVLVVKEILTLPEVMQTKTTNKEMKEFVKFLKVHPAWAKPEFFWAELSEGFEITLEDFTRDSMLLLQRFTKQQEMAHAADAGMSVKDRCAKVFAQLDVQMSGGVGLNELIPMSGEDKKAAASNLAKFTVPLNFIKEIRIDKARTSGAGEEERQTVRFQVHPDFENSAEWKKVKKGLSPDWEPNHNFEYLQVAMVPQYLDMWKQVISDCGMDTIQEFVRFYNGSTLEHPVLDGVYMRHGEGTQRWPDGKTYKGYWENHVYEGPGKLFNDYEDMANNVNAIYDGEWKNGKRHGEGVLRWEQDNSDRARKTFGDRQFSGVRKIYEGQFQYDCFHGQGKMKLEKAVSQSLRTMDRQGLSPGRVPLPNMDPSYILSFDGLWESDWTKTDAEAREISPLYENLHPKMPDDHSDEMKAHRELKLDTVTKVERMQNLPHMRFARYFPLDPMEVQAAGDPLPDLALAYYQSKGGDANHMSDGLAVYADFTEYQGFFAEGRPSGKGKMTQFDHKDGKKGAELASYEGSWKNGKFEGEGVYTTADGLKYVGNFKEHLRHGKGVETVEEELACKIGYSKYEGNWENGLFHGEGALTYGDPKGGMGRVVYKGTFVEGKRTGDGRVYDVKDGHLKLVCKFENDKIVTSKSKEEYGWLCLDRRKQDGEGPGKYFYGVIGQDGELGTWGTLYSARAVQDPDFLQCVQEGKPYQKENPQNEQLQYILYHGQWKDSVPDGFGVQHFAGAQMTLEKNPMHQAHGGTYTGDFLNGKRHGRGVWKTTAGAWEFRPIANEDVPNWEKDLMHGIGIVEDFEHVHENVIYTKGKCQMPFTELGPPKTGFESAAFSDVLPQAGRKRIYVTPLPTTENPEEEKNSPEKENPIWLLLKGFGQKLHKQQDEGWEALDREHELAFLRATAKSMGHSTQAMARMNSAVTNTLTMRSMPTSTAGAEPAVAALVREPTDLSLPEEDVLIKGGTGENEVINGVYFKLMHTFGVKAFKMVKQVQSGFYTTTVVRYLYWDHVTSAWTISPKPLGGVCLAPGCAFAQEDNTEHPSMVTKPWYVWHGYTGELLAAGEEIKEKKEEEAGFTLRSLMPEPTPVDKIVAKSIVGFQVQGNQDKLGKIGMGLMLRIPLTLFGRPVYEYEGGGQYLYFHRKKEDGTMEDMAAGQDAELEEFGAGIEPTPERLYESSGCWIIATEMGIELESPECYAVVEDTAVTPDQITRTWMVRSRDKMEPNKELRFTAQEWSHEGTLQAMVEQVEKEEREAEEAEEEESESQEEKKDKKKDEKTEKKEKKKGWLG